jgi:hypothetical protein
LGYSGSLKVRIIVPAPLNDLVAFVRMFKGGSTAVEAGTLTFGFLFLGYQDS